MVHAEQLCDHVVMIHRGVKVLDDEIGAIRARFDPRTLLFEPLDPEADVGALARIPGVVRVRKDGADWEISLDPGAERASVIRQVAATVPTARVELRRPTLEDVFIGIVSDTAVESDGDSLRAAVRNGGDARKGLER
jgi:ABC-2 type transport system ATP-binding protein